MRATVLALATATAMLLLPGCRHTPVAYEDLGPDGREQAVPWAMGASGRLLFTAGHPRPGHSWLWAYEHGRVRRLSDVPNCHPYAVAGGHEVPVLDRSLGDGVFALAALPGLALDGAADDLRMERVLLRDHLMRVAVDPLSDRVAVLCEGPGGGHDWWLGVLPISPPWSSGRLRCAADGAVEIVWDWAGDLVASVCGERDRYELARIDPASGARQKLTEVTGSVPFLSAMGPGRPTAVLVSWSSGNEPKYGVLDVPTGRLEVAFAGPTGWFVCASPGGTRVAWVVEPGAVRECRQSGGPAVRGTTLKAGLCVLDLRTRTVRQLTLNANDIVAGFATETELLYFRQVGNLPSLRAADSRGSGDREVWRLDSADALPRTRP